MLKKQLLNKIGQLSASSESSSQCLASLTKWAESLPDDQPDLLPFQWPVKPGYEVVTRDGRKVEQLVRFDAKDEQFQIMGVLGSIIESWTNDGLYSPNASNGSGGADLFLRRKEKKVWVVDYIGVLDFYEDKEDANDHNEDVYDGKAKVYQILVKPFV